MILRIVLFYRCYIEDYYLFYFILAKLCVSGWERRETGRTNSFFSSFIKILEGHCDTKEHSNNKVIVNFALHLLVRAPRFCIPYFPSLSNVCEYGLDHLLGGFYYFFCKLHYAISIMLTIFVKYNLLFYHGVTIVPAQMFDVE